MGCAGGPLLASPRSPVRYRGDETDAIGCQGDGCDHIGRLEGPVRRVGLTALGLREEVSEEEEIKLPAFGGLSARTKTWTSV